MTEKKKDIFNCYKPPHELDKSDKEWLPKGKYGVNDAIESLRPGALYQLYNTTFTKWWHKDNPPTWEELALEMSRLRKVAYKAVRKEEYPLLEDFADAYYWQQRGDDSKMKAYLEKIDEVKAKYKKEDYQ